MIMKYKKFIKVLNKHIKNDDSFIYELLVTVVKNPNRYTGIFRLSNAKTKLIQNVTQSQEIKFGDFMEDIVTEYIAAMGYNNLNKSIGNDEEGNALSADQVFMKGNTVYLIEQKIRDDHDSTKKKGQYDNFRKKYALLKRKYPKYNINATMWFIDNTFAKNRKYYTEESKRKVPKGVNIHIFYGGELFDKLFKEPDVWKEICTHLKKNKKERANEVINIPDFDTSDEVKAAIRKLKTKKPKLYKKLISDKPEYIQLRNELFPSGINI